MARTKDLEDLFKELRALTTNHPKPPESWTDGVAREIRAQCAVCGPVTPQAGAEASMACPKCGQDLADTPFFIWQSYKNFGEWLYVQRDKDEQELEATGRTTINREIGHVLAEVDPRTFGQDAEELAVAYEILDIISAGLGHGDANQCSAKRLLSYLDVTSEFALQWASLWVRAAISKQDFASAQNLLDELAGGESARYSTAFARAKALHGTFYLAHATIALVHCRDVQAAIEWADRAKRSCVGIPGVVEKAIGIKRILSAARRRIAGLDDDDEEAAIDEVVSALGAGERALLGVSADVKKLTGGH